MPLLQIRWWHPWFKSCHRNIRDLSCCERNWPLSRRPRSPQSRQDLQPHPTFSFYGGTPYSGTLAFSLRSWALWGRLHSKVLTSWVQTPKSYRTGLGPSGKLTEWQAHPWHLPRNPRRPRQAQKWYHPPGRNSPGPPSLTILVHLEPLLYREPWHRSSPFVLAPAGEPAIYPTQINTARLRRLLQLPQPVGVEGVQVGAHLADFAPQWRSLLGTIRATSIVEDRVGITFHQRPQLTHQCISFRTRNSRQDLHPDVDALLLKGAIERVTNVTSLGY